MKFKGFLFATVLVMNIIPVSFAEAQEDSLSEIERLEEVHYIISHLFAPINFDVDYKCQKWGTTRVLFDFRITAIFYGKVIDITESTEPNEKIVTLSVENVWHGNLSESVTVTTKTDPCGMAFLIDKEYLVYTTGDEQNLIATYSMVSPPNEDPPPPGMPRSFAYDVEGIINNIENRIGSEKVEEFNQHRDKIASAYYAITEWEKNHNAEIRFGLANVVEQQKVLDIGIDVEGGQDISKEDLESLFNGIFGDINIRLFYGGTLVREDQNTSGITIKPPLKQVRDGTPPEFVICKEGLQLIFKLSDGSPACVKPQTVEKLIERGWGIS